MARLTIEKRHGGAGLQTMKITGFGEGELSGLKSMPHETARDRLLEMLDERNSGTGTSWMCGYGVYGLWFDNEAAYVNIGTSCD